MNPPWVSQNATFFILSPEAEKIKYKAYVLLSGTIVKSSVDRHLKIMQPFVNLTIRKIAQSDPRLDKRKYHAGCPPLEIWLKNFLDGESSLRYTHMVEFKTLWEDLRVNPNRI